MYARHEAALAELTQSVLTNIDLPTLMRQAATLVAQTLAVAYSAIWELCADPGTLVLRFGIGWREGAAEQRTVAVGPASHVGSTVLGTTPVIVKDVPTSKHS